MRLLILVQLSLLPLSACMTQRDRMVWEELKAEISSDKASDIDSKAEMPADDSEASAAEAEAEAADSEAVTPPTPAEKVAE